MTIKTCKECGYTGEEFRKKRAICISCDKVKACLRMKEHRSTDAYKQWLVDSREYRLKLKEKYRRQSGAKEAGPRLFDSHVKAYLRQVDIEAMCIAKAVLHNSHVRCMRSLSDADYRRWNYKNDPQYALYHRVKRWMHKYLGNGLPSSKWAHVLGWTPNDLKAHLEKQFIKGMSWDNKGEWHIDHITPVAAFHFTSECDQELKAAYALSNLRPIWGKDNMEKGKKIVCLI